MQKGNGFRFSDLALLVGVGAFIIFMVYGQMYMFHQDPSKINFSVGTATLIFSFGMIAFICFLVGEAIRKNKAHWLITLLFIGLTIVGLVPIILSKDSFTFNEITVSLRYENKIIFVYELVMMMTFIYSGIFVLSRRFHSYGFLIVLSYIVFAFVTSIAIYSYVKEYENIANYFLVLFGYKEGTLTPVISYMINPNAVGMAMLVGIIFAFIAHAVKPHWWYYPIALFFLLNLMLTYCRGSIALGVLVFIIFVYYRLIITFKKHKVRNIVLICLYSTLIVGVGVIFGITIALKGSFLPHLHHALDMITNSGTLESRVDIYKDCFAILKIDNGYILGRGFGIINLILTNVHGHNSYVLPTHNAFIGVLGEGGIPFVAGYLGLTIYAYVMAFKTFKKSKDLTFISILAITAFLAYSVIETIQYVMYLFIFILLMVRHVTKVKCFGVL